MTILFKLKKFLNWTEIWTWILTAYVCIVSCRANSRAIARLMIAEESKPQYKGNLDYLWFTLFTLLQKAFCMRICMIEVNMFIESKALSEFRGRFLSNSNKIKYLILFNLYDYVMHNIKCKFRNVFKKFFIFDFI